MRSQWLLARPLGWLLRELPFGDMGASVEITARSPVHKPIERPDHISILPGGTRGDPLLVGRFLQSLVDTTTRPDLIDVWFAIDEGDRAAAAVLAELGERLPFAVHAVEVGPPTSNGVFLNLPRAVCTSNPGIWGFISDKVQIRTRGWDEMVRRTFRGVPDGILFVHGHDGHPDFGAFGFLGARWTNITGRMFTDEFPYWFDDVWINDVAGLIGRRVALPIILEMEMGVARHLHNALFWAHYYASIFPDRVDEGLRLLAAMGAAGNSRALAILQATRDKDGVGLPTREIWVRSERQRSFRLRGANPRPSPGERVLRAEEAALLSLARRLAVARWKGASNQAEQIADGMQYATSFADHLYQQGEAARARQDRAEAGRCVQELVSRFPNFPETWWLAIELADQTGDSAEAASLARLSEAVLPAEPRLLSLRRRLLGDTG